MPAGRKPAKAPVIQAPPIITQSSITSPTGDVYSTTRSGNTQLSDIKFSSGTQQAIDTSQYGLNQAAQQLNQPDVKMIEQNAARFYDIQADSINSAADNLVSQQSADLSKRFGGTYNSTFGATAIAKIQDSRLRTLYNASREAMMYGQDIYNQQQNTSMNRFQTFNDYLRGQFEQAYAVSGDASDLLLGEGNRGQNLSVQQAQLQMEADIANQRLAQSAAQRRLSLLKSLSGNIVSGVPSILR